MITVMGRAHVYTVEEIDKMLAETAGFMVVDKLPARELAKENYVYYKKTKDTYLDEDGGVHATVMPYVPGTDGDGNKCWYCGGSSGGAGSYEQLSKLPSINGEKFIRDLDADKARKPVSVDGFSGGYDLSIHDEDIIAVVREAYA